METLRQLLAEHGLALVFANVLLAQLGLPLPAVPMLVVAGALVAEGTLHFLPLALAVMVASLAGDVPWYFAGRRYGYRVLRTVCRLSIEPDSCVKQTERIFTRWGPPSLIVAKYVPGFSTVGPPLAGAMQLRFGPFLAYSAAAALLWAATPVVAGILFHREVEWALKRLEAMGAGAVAVLAGLIVLYIAFKAVERYRLIRLLRMIRIDVGDLRGMIDARQEPFILDVRSALAREAQPRRIPGAIAVPLDLVESVFDRIPPDRDIVLYCS